MRGCLVSLGKGEDVEMERVVNKYFFSLFTEEACLGVGL